MQTLDIPYQNHAYRIHLRPPRRNNRRLRLSVDGGGTLYLSHPPRSRRADIEHFIRSNLAWIAAHAHPQEERPAAPYADGSLHHLLGERYRLILDPAATARIRIDGSTFITLPAADATLAARFRAFHRVQSMTHFPVLVAAALLHCPWVAAMPPLRYRHMRRTWGNCSHDGIITLSTALIQYPPAQIHHVIIHELCHLQEHNHSAAFYALMDAAQPDWRAHKAALAAYRREHRL
ncbi:SprT family zinc-dependent metalloprotease [uncultured Cardiobacterium sp.]|uniref:M48 family metallopeptidase n=1 Tax=uncultured Cardiobacterium sp. TaxID=417619 RepID=UPI002619602B|nr:SprT family zinc-dependent metalloprotease [uncultured Cardiobacterium sp.]